MTKLCGHGPNECDPKNPDCLADLIRELRAREPRWIPLRERVPEWGERVLILCDRGTSTGSTASPDGMFWQIVIFRDSREVFVKMPLRDEVPEKVIVLLEGSADGDKWEGLGVFQGAAVPFLRARVRTNGPGRAFVVVPLDGGAPSRGAGERRG